MILLQWKISLFVPLSDTNILILVTFIFSYHSLLSSSLDEKGPETQRYGSTHHNRPSPNHRRRGEYVDRRGAGGREGYNRTPPGPSSYRRSPERRYDGGHRAGFRSAARKRSGAYGGYGKGRKFIIVNVTLHRIES